MTEFRRRPGPESTLDNAREQLIAAATTRLLESGVDLGLTNVTLTAAVSATGIARATAYRSLTHDEFDPQEYLRREVLTRLLSRDSRAATHQAVDSAVTDELDRHQELLATGDVASRTRAMRALIRVGCAASYTAVVASTERAILIAAYGALRSQSERAPLYQRQALQQGELEIVRLFAELYSGLSELFGYQLKLEYTIGQFSTAAAAMVEGMAMRSGVSEALVGLKRPTGHGGEQEEWTLFAVGFEGLYRQMFEPRSTSEPFADLDRY